MSLQNESEENLPDVSRPQGFSLQANPEHREQVNQPCFPSGLESPYRGKKNRGGVVKMMSMNCVGVFIPRLVECLQAVLQAPREFLGGKKSENSCCFIPNFS